MVTGTYVFTNLNKSDLEIALKDVIKAGDLGDDINNALLNANIGTVQVDDVIQVIEIMRLSTATAPSIDLMPIVNAVSTELLAMNTLINKELFSHAILKYIESTSIYDSINPLWSDILQQERRNRLLDFYTKIVNGMLDKEDMTNMSEENLRNILTKINLSISTPTLLRLISKELGIEDLYIALFVTPMPGGVIATIPIVQFDIDAVLMLLNALISERINRKNLRLAIKEIIQTDLYDSILDEVLNEFDLTTLDEATIRKILEKFIMRLVGTEVYIDIDKALQTIMNKLSNLGLFNVVVGSDMTVDITPDGYIKGVTNITSQEVFLTVNEPKAEDYIVKIDDNNIALSIKNCMLQTNAIDFNIKARVKSPTVKVSVFGGSQIQFEEEDAWKILTNDGTTLKWQYIETFAQETFGLLKSVETLADRDSIPSKYLTNGMIVYVKSLGVYYTLVDKDSNTWDIFKVIDLKKEDRTRKVIYRDIKLGHGDTGTDLEISRLVTLVINTPDEFTCLEDYVDQTQPNLVSFKNVSFNQAYININGGSHILNPNSVLEIPFDFTMKVMLKGLFNYVGAYVKFLVIAESATTTCTKGFKEQPISLFSPEF